MLLENACFCFEDLSINCITFVSLEEKVNNSISGDVHQFYYTFFTLQLVHNSKLFFIQIYQLVVQDVWYFATISH